MKLLKTRLIQAADRVWRAFLKYGPVDDGRPEGDEFDDALVELRATARFVKAQADAERNVLAAVAAWIKNHGNEIQIGTNEQVDPWPLLASIEAVLKE